MTISLSDTTVTTYGLTEAEIQAANLEFRWRSALEIRIVSSNVPISRNYSKAPKGKEIRGQERARPYRPVWWCRGARQKRCVVRPKKRRKRKLRPPRKRRKRKLVLPESKKNTAPRRRMYGGEVDAAHGTRRHCKKHGWHSRGLDNSQ